MKPLAIPLFALLLAALPLHAEEPTVPESEPATEEIVLAGGCFWCVEVVYEQLAGVLDVESGYAGGSAETANYKAVCTGRTKHAEVVRVRYDPDVLSLETLLEVFLKIAHDPTHLNRQGNDVGPQYRSAVFFADDAQRNAAEKAIAKMADQGVYEDPIVTTLEPLETFHPAEAYHQDYARLNPNQNYIVCVAWPKVKKLRETYPELLRKEEE